MDYRPIKWAFWKSMSHPNNDNNFALLQADRYRRGGCVLGGFISGDDLQ